MNKRLLLILMVLSPILLTACSMASGGGPLATVYAGQSTHYYPTAFQPTFAAATQVLGQMHCVILHTESVGTSPQGGVIHARNGHMLVDVTIMPKGPQVTAVATRFGLLGSAQDDQHFHILLKAALSLG